MSNDVSANPWKLDTTGAVSSAVERIERVRIVGMSTAGHTAELRDAAGSTIVSFVAAGSNYTEDVPVHREVTGVTLQTLQSGTVFVLISKRPRAF